MIRQAAARAGGYALGTPSTCGGAGPLPLRGTESARTRSARPRLLQCRALRRPPPADCRDGRAACRHLLPEVVPPRYRPSGTEPALLPYRDRRVTTGIPARPGVM